MVSFWPREADGLCAWGMVVVMQSEELLRTFSFATTRVKVANSSSGKMVISRYRIRYFFQKRAAFPLTLLEN